LRKFVLRKVLSKEECAHVPTTVGFTEEELDAALIFLNETFSCP
jgi:hypothetical protein